MSRLNRIPTWGAILVVGFLAAALSLYVSAVHPEIGQAVAFRTYVFWAVVTAPVAYLAEMLIRTFVQYRWVKQLASRLQTVKTK